MFAPRKKLIALSAAGLVALGVTTQSTAQAPAKQHASPGHAGAKNQDLARSSARSKAVADYQRAVSDAGNRPAGGDLATVQKMSTTELRHATARLTPDSTISSDAASTGFASPESFGVSQSTLDAIAACESGGNPSAVSADGTYRGLYQFDYGTWASMGGSGDPAAASPAEQSMRAAMLYSEAGSSPWPICG